MDEVCSWTAYLSDGRSINEKDLFSPNDVLPFKKLITQCYKEGVDINCVTLNVKGVRYNSPSKSERGNFVSSVEHGNFWISYRDRFMPMQDMAVSFIGLSWRTGEDRTTLWVSLSSDKPISWVEIRKAVGRQEEIIDLYYSGGTEQ